MVPIANAPDAPSKMTVDEVKQTLEKLGIAPAEAEKLAETVDQPPQDEPEDAGYRTLEELPDEALDELMDDMLSSEDMEQSFDELIDRYLEEMNGAVTEDDFRSLEEDEDGPDFELPDDPEQWQELIDELFPTDDLIVQEGDDEGFDDPSKWVMPDMPGEDWSEPEISSGVEDDEDEDDEDDENDEDDDDEDEENDIYDLICGSYSCSETVVTEWFDDGSVDFYDDEYTVVISRSGNGLTFNVDAYGYSAWMSFNADTMTGTVSDDGLTMTFTFRQNGDSVSFHASGTDTDYEDYRDTITLDGWKN